VTGTPAKTAAAALGPSPDDGFSTLFEFLPVGAYRTRPDGQMLRANPALVALNGFASEAEQLAAVDDIAGQWYVEPGRRAEFQRLMDRDGRVMAFESEIHRYKTRERIWISENAHLVRAPDGKPLYYEGTVEDITARRRAQLALQRSEEDLRALLRQVPGAMYRVREAPGEPRRIDFLSEGAVGLVGLPAQALVDDILLLQRLRHPDDRKSAFEEVERATREDRPLAVEYRIVRPDGEVRWVAQTSRALPGQPPGHVVRVGLMLDVTARKQAEEALRQSEGRWKLALDSLGDGIWDWNLATGEEVLSPRCLEMYGYAEGALPSRAEALDRLTHPDDVAAMRRAREDHFAGRTPVYANEHRVRCQDGRWKWVLSRGMVIERGPGGRPLRMIGTHTDITERKEAEALRLERDRAAAADRAKTLFLSRVSHELRTPLNAILGFAQLLQLRHDDPARMAQAAALPTADEHAREGAWMRQIVASGRHLLALMDDILDLSSAQTGQMPLHLQPLPLAPLLAEACAMLAVQTQEAEVTLALDAVPAAPALAVRADRKRLLQIASNLVGNAIKYNRRGGWVRLDARALPDGRVEFGVADSGPGLTLEQQARLFQPFERLGAQVGPVEGTGLGLALCRQLAEAMGGEVGVTSQPGQGARFWVRLPGGA
jgi:PAS domain S-box-containing protein